MTAGIVAVLWQFAQLSSKRSRRPKPGDTTQLSGNTVCRATLLQRVASGPDSLVDEGTTKNVSPELCNLLTNEELSAIFNSPVEADPGDDKCDWTLVQQSTTLTIYRSDYPGKIAYDKSYQPPCQGGSMGYYETHLDAECTVGKISYGFDIPAYEEPSDQLVDQLTKVVQTAMAKLK
jgi:hypothetical protein